LAVAIIRGKNLKRGKTRREKGERKRKRRKDKGTTEVKKVNYINAKGEKIKAKNAAISPAFSIRILYFVRILTQFKLIVYNSSIRG
jgi:hypothetical protein